MSAACHLAYKGYSVKVFEKNATIGGRARQLKREGFTFDMGPSWYWMPDIFEGFFNYFGKKASDYYQLDRLDPGYQVVFEDEIVPIAADLEEIAREFERLEPGSSKELREFAAKARDNYRIAIEKVVWRPGLSPLELITPETALRVNQFFSNISRDIRKRFKNPKLISILEFPVLFLGAKPQNTPSFYSFMNHADFGLGTWHPKGGMYEIVKAQQSLAEELGVRFSTHSEVERILVRDGKTHGIQLHTGETVEADVVLSGADYAHTETLLEGPYRQYSGSYWESRTFAPSSLLFYVGFEGKIDGVLHHNLFFDTDFERHAREIYDTAQWPEAPLFYANFPSVTDKSMAPEGKEAGFFLIPVAPGLANDDDELREKYFGLILERIHKRLGIDLRDRVLFKESFGVSDFISKYHSYKGNAYGMANTLNQTAFLRPGLKSKKIANLYFTGQLTVPGPGVPPSLISGKLVADLIEQKLPVT